MAIHLIGSTPSEPQTTQIELPQAEVELPRPESAPAGSYLLDEQHLTELLKHEDPLVRAYAVEQIGTRKLQSMAKELVDRIWDEDEVVATQAISVVDDLKHTEAVPALKERFLESQGAIAAACGTAIGRLAPETLLEAVQNRRRLDTEAYAAVTTSLATIDADEVRGFFKKAISRAKLLPPDRRGTLFGAGLLTGDASICKRLVGDAVGDSNAEAPPNTSFPTRAALCAVAALPVEYSRVEKGLEVYDQARENIEREVLPTFSEEAQKPLNAALKAKMPGEVIKALAPVLEFDTSNLDSELRSMPKRRQGLLKALIDRADDIEKLELPAATIFVAAATQASVLVVAGSLHEKDSEAAIGIAKALPVPMEPAELVALSNDELGERFESLSPRDARKVSLPLTRQAFRRADTFRKFCAAMFAADHGATLLEAAAEVKDAALHGLVVEAAAQSIDSSEAALLKLLEAETIPAESLALTMVIAETLRTERIGLALARRFYELRKLDQAKTARALLRVGDARALPLLESRAYPEEAEELSWVVLSLVHGKEIKDKLAESLERLRSFTNEDERPLRIPLKCNACGEALVYRFERAFVDPEAKDEWGDPAFVGHQECKACGTANDFGPTPEAGTILTNHMLQVLNALQQGLPPPSGLVAPMQIEIGGKKIGFAKAQRQLDQEIEASPEAIRPRLRRARLRLLLKYQGVEDDLATIFAEDRDAVEASFLQAALTSRDGQHTSAMSTLHKAHQLLNGEAEPRLYDTDDKQSLLESLEDSMLDLMDRGAMAPAELSLTAAKERRQAREDQALEREAAMSEAMEQRRAGIPPNPNRPRSGGGKPKKRRR